MRYGLTLRYLLLAVSFLVLPVAALRVWPAAQGTGIAEMATLLVALAYLLLAQLWAASRIGMLTAAALASMLAGVIFTLTAAAAGICPGRQTLLLLPCTGQELSLYYLLGLLQWAFLSALVIAAILVVRLSMRVTRAALDRGEEDDA